MIRIPTYKWWIVERFWEGAWGYVRRYSTPEAAHAYKITHETPTNILRVVAR